MTSPSFYEQGSQLLTAGAFDFVLEGEIRRAGRSKSVVTLVLVETNREWDGLVVTADNGTVQEIGRIIGREVRETDPLGHTGRGALALVLPDADFESSTRIIDRLFARIDNYELPAPLRIAVGAACYPTHAVDAVGLKRQATNRSVACWRPQTS